MIWFSRELITIYPLAGLDIKKWIKSNAKITFLSYFSNYKNYNFNSSEFNQTYWGDLPKELNSRNISSNWLYLYVRQYNNINRNDIKRYIKAFNKDKSDKNVYVMLQSFIDFEIVYKVIIKWIKLNIKGIQINLRWDQPKLLNQDLWFLFKADFK